jgi:hypothetical protein
MEAKSCSDETKGESLEDFLLLYPPRMWKYRRIFVLQGGSSCQVNTRGGEYQRQSDKKGQDAETTKPSVGK